MFNRKEWLQSLKVGDAVVYCKGSGLSHWKSNTYTLQKITGITTNGYFVLDHYNRIPVKSGSCYFDNSANDECIFPYTDEEFPENPFDANSSLVSMKYIIEYHQLMEYIKQCGLWQYDIETLREIKTLLESRKTE